MTTLCPCNYIPSNISTSMDQIEVSLKKVPLELQKLYKQKQSCDLILKNQKKQLLVHRSVIQKNSTLFCKGLSQNSDKKYVFEIKSKCKKQLIQKILSCLYGYCITVRRCQIQQAYQICKSLEIKELLRILRFDMINHFDEYQIFPLLKLATQQQITEVIELCYDQLEMEQYQPMRYNKSGLLICQQQLFKMIVKRHNFQKQQNQKYGLSTTQINGLVQQYCEANGIKQQKKQTFKRDISYKQNARYFVSLTQVLKNSSTPRKVKSSSQILFRNTLTLPRSKDQHQNSSFQIQRNRRQSISDKFPNKKDDEDGKYSPLNYCKSQAQQRSISNYSTDNKSLQNRSRKESLGSGQTVSDPKIVTAILFVTTNQKAISQANIEIKNKAEEILMKLKHELINSKQKNQKIKKCQNFLEEIQAEVISNSSRLQELQKTIGNIEVTQHKRQVKKKFDQMFETSIALDLTVSRQFGIKAKQKAVKT